MTSTTTTSSKAKSELLFMGFNQDASCVSIGTTTGYRIFNCMPFGRNLFSAEGGIGIVEQLFCTSLVALVGNTEPENARLRLWNTQTTKLICELSFSSRILAVRMNRKRLIVVLETQLHIYDLDSMVNLQTLNISISGTLLGSESSKNSKLLATPICELSADNNSLLCLPANGMSGDVFLYDALNLVEFSLINAHKTPIACMKFSQDGSMLATASDKGTVIRVFAVPSGEKLFSFRRGTYSATIYSLAMNESGTMLAASSNSGSIHVFALGDDTGDCNNQDTVASGESELDDGGNDLARSRVKKNPGRRGNSLASRLLPSSLTDIVEPCRNFAIARLENHNVVARCAFVKGTLCVVSSDGHFYQYEVRPGACELTFEMSLLGGDSNKDDEGFTTRYFSGKTTTE